MARLCQTGDGSVPDKGNDTWRLSPESNRGKRICNPVHSHSATQPSVVNIHAKTRPDMERETRFELATSTLARLRSTN